MMVLIRFFMEYGYIILGIAFGITASMFLTTIFLEKSIENGNKTGDPEDFEAQIKFVVADSSATPPTELMSNPGFYYRNTK